MAGGNTNGSPFTVCANLKWSLTLSDKPYSTFSDTIHSPPLLEVYLIISPDSANLPIICFFFFTKKIEAKQKVNYCDKPPQNFIEKTMRALGSKQTVETQVGKV